MRVSARMNSYRCSIMPQLWMIFFIIIIRNMFMLYRGLTFFCDNVTFQETIGFFLSYAIDYDDVDTVTSRSKIDDCIFFFKMTYMYDFSSMMTAVTKKDIFFSKRLHYRLFGCDTRDNVCLDLQNYRYYICVGTFLLARKVWT